MQVKVEKEKLPRPSATGQRAGVGVAASRLPSKDVVLSCIDSLDMDIARVEARAAIAKAKRSEWLRRCEERREGYEDEHHTKDGDDSGEGDREGATKVGVKMRNDGSVDEGVECASGGSAPRRQTHEVRERQQLLKRRAEELDARVSFLHR